MKDNNYCVIMAGGIGSRFWPLSKTSKPKQFIDILGTGKTLIQNTFERFEEFCLPENIYVVTNVKYKAMVMEQLPKIPVENILLEPARKNTAPCIAYANQKIIAKNSNANIIVAPADHIIINTNVFNNEINKALDFVSKQHVLVTIGVTPNRPDTGYGYIQVNTETDFTHEYKNLYPVKTFTEKPNLEMAKKFVDSGEFYWNSGIFVWNINSIQYAFKEYLPEVKNLFKEGKDKYNTPEEEAFIQKVYSECKNISIDYGIMEKAENVHVFTADFGWSDLGTWGSLFENSERDEDNNATSSDNVLTYDTENTIVKTPSDKLVVVQGLNDYIVAESDNVLLICNKKEEQQLRYIVNDVKLKKGELKV